MIELQQKLLGDKVRNAAFYQALKRVIKKGETVVADIGAGTGFLSFLARKLGAKECHLYEYSNILEIAKRLARDNKIDGCRFVEAHSVDIKNPPKVDVVVSEILGNYALEENIIESIEDAKRFLKPGGVIIPQKIQQFAAPVISPRIYDEINTWDDVGYDLNLTAVQEAALNNMYVYKILPADLMDNGKSAQIWDKIDFEKREKSVRSGTASWDIKKSCKIYGLAVWWNVNLVDDIVLSTSPLEKPTHWDQIFLPLTSPLQAQKGDKLEIALNSDSRYEVGIRLQWEAKITRAGKTIQAIKMDTQRGAY